jgi:hypothetical protein
VNAEKTKQIFMPEDQNAGENNNIKIDKKNPLKLFRNKPLESKFHSGRN